MGWEWFVPRYKKLDQDESLAAFFRRRVGHEAFNHFIEPLVAGIYAGNAEELSLKATFPRFFDLEQQYGSLIKGMRAQTVSSAGSQVHQWSEALHVHYPSWWSE